MVYEVSDKYTNRKVKNFGRDCTIVVEGILKAKILIAMHYRVERD
jgi:hypothetical protein